MAGANWTAVGGIAQLVAAAATLLLAGVTAWMAKRTHDVAEEAKQQATAAAREAEATEHLALEARIDRQLVWRPYVVIQVTGIRPGEGGTQLVAVEITNLGNGPALDCTIWCHRDEEGFWGRSDHYMVLAPRESWKGSVLLVSRDASALPEQIFTAPLGGVKNRSGGVVTCRDALDNLWRFVRDNRPELVRVDDAPPKWVHHLGPASSR